MRSLGFALLLPLLAHAGCPGFKKAVNVVGAAVQECGQETIAAGESAVAAVHEGSEGWIDDVFAAIRLVKSGVCIARVIEAHIKAACADGLASCASPSEGEVMRARLSMALARAWHVPPSGGGQ